MESINKDNLFSILQFLDFKTLVSISKTNKFIHKEFKNNKKLILRTKVSEIWGTNVCDFIPNDKIDRFLKYNINTFFNLLELFYKEVINGSKTSSLLLIEIYDHIYNFTNSYDFIREKIFHHRTRTIQKLVNYKKVSNKDKRIIFILNSTAYLNRFCFFLDGTSLTISHNRIFELINQN